MQQRQNARQLMMIGGGVIAFVLVIAFFLSHRGGSGSASAEKTDTVPVVVASQTVPTGTVFKAGQKLSDLFTVKQVPSSLAPFGAYTKVQSIENLTNTPGCGPVKADGCDGQVTTVQTIYQGTPVVS